MTSKEYRASARIQAQINTVFHPHSMTEEQQERANNVREALQQAAAQAATSCPDGRELSIVLTKLEEACMFAVAAIARETETA